MDPTFRHTVLVFLRDLDTAHTYADGTTDGNPATPCTCGDPQAQGRDRHLLEVIAAVFAEPELAPHLVVTENVYEDQDVSEAIPDANSTFAEPKVRLVEKTERVRRQVVNQCPDCGLGLVSRGDDMVCSRLSLEVDIHGKDGDVIACGVDRNGELIVAEVPARG